MKTPTKSAESATCTLVVDGMTCAACVGHVEKALNGTPGVEGSAVSLLANEASVSYDPARTTPGALKAAIEDAGYEVPAAKAVVTPDRN